MKRLYTLALLLISIASFAQPPALIPYQAIARDASGNALLNQNIGLRFSIHDQTITGNIVWQEVQTVLSSSLGVIVTNLGSVSDLSAVNWANGSKFLQMEMNVTGGTNYTDIGTQQMMSVPYALHAGGVYLNVSPTGDTLFVGDGSFVVIPGISEANNFTSGTTIHSCGTPNVHNSNLTYGSMTDQEGHVYKTIVIGSQEWMAENLNTGIYRNGDHITTGLDDAAWSVNTSGAWTYYNNDSGYACPFGKLYNWYACVDPRQLCPLGWHVPSDDEWNVLGNYFGGLESENTGAALKSIGTLESGTGYWIVPNDAATNSSGFSGLPGGQKWYTGTYAFIGVKGAFWSSSEADTVAAWPRFLLNYFGYLNSLNEAKRTGLSIRCLKD
jgi:uncharacterized protein (TIGR02145 family)